MSLLIGSQVTAETLGWQLTIQKKLGEGGQGVAYLASGPAGNLVVKWYNAEQATDAQRQAIRQLVKDGPPTGLAGQRFVWPLDVVTAPQSRRFGSLMSVIDRVLHLRGMCYRDISKGNLMFDSRTGEVLICDNDNVGIKWQTLFRQLKDGVLNCGGCQAVNLWDTTRPSLECWHAGFRISPPHGPLGSHSRRWIAYCSVVVARWLGRVAADTEREFHSRS